MDNLELVPPVHNPDNILCIGINYKKRYPLDTALHLPDNIILFGKHIGSLTGHSQRLEIPLGDAARTLDYEGEIAVVIGRAGRHICVENALDYIGGYTVLNDGSVREWQKQSLHAGKNFYHSGACGPYMVTSDEIADSSALELRTWLNGELVQQVTADQMLFSIAEQISYISHLMPLAAGDIIATGSPEGSGGSRVPQRFLQAGDHLEIEVSGVGRLSNVVGEV
jgi:2-keto-4-pentenoate hydratase/2-oxohepta-3-ene-1,7-dioic acid hydratase in catechol pathway